MMMLKEVEGMEVWSRDPRHSSKSVIRTASNQVQSAKCKIQKKEIANHNQ